MYTFGAPLAELASEKPAMWEILDLLDDLLPKDKPGRWGEGRYY